MGFCAETAYPSREGDCQNGWSGSWKPQKHGITSLRGCATMCRSRCPACRYVSYAKDDCSWFRECSLPLQQKPSGYATIAVNRSLTAPPPRKSGSSGSSEPARLRSQEIM